MGKVAFSGIETLQETERKNFAGEKWSLSYKGQENRGQVKGGFKKRLN